MSYPHPIWKNDEHDVYWRHDGREEWVDGVESFTLRWTGDPRTEEGCPAEVLLVVRMPTPITSFENGNSLRVVHVPCGPRGTSVFDQDDIRLRLERCVVIEKILDSVITQDPAQKAIVGVAMQLEGTLRLW